MFNFQNIYIFIVGIGMYQKRCSLVFVGIPCRRTAAVFLYIVVGIFSDVVVSLK